MEVIEEEDIKQIEKGLLSITSDTAKLMRYFNQEFQKKLEESEKLC